MSKSLVLELLMCRYLAKSAQIQFHIFVSTEVIAAKWSKHIGVEQGKGVMKQIGIRLTRLS